LGAAAPALQINVEQYQSDSAALAAIVTAHVLTVSDTAEDIVADAAQLSADASVDALKVVDTIGDVESNFDASNAYAGARYFYAGSAALGHAQMEIDTNSVGALTRLVLSGVTGQSYKGSEADYAGGVQDALILTNKNGSHVLTGLNGATGLTFSSAFNDVMTGGASGESFSFAQVFGADEITDFASYATGANHDVISLSSANFANFTAVLGAANNVGANVVIQSSASTLTLDNMNVAALAGLSADFSFHK
jgi:hypothetical protein